MAAVWLSGWLSTGIELATPPAFGVLRTRIEAEIAGGWEVTVADPDGEVAGFVALSRHDRQLEQIFVAPHRHRMGVGSALLAYARRAMPDGFTLWTHGENHGAARFYLTAGMEPLGPGVHPRLSHPILTFGYGGGLS